MRSSRSGDFWLRLAVFSIVMMIMVSLLALSSVSMKNHPRVADAGDSIAAHQFEEITFNASELQDTSSDEENLIYIWYFGDGETAANEVVKHAYRRTGSYTATLVVIDDDGSKSIESIEVSITGAETTRELRVNWFFIFVYMSTVLTVIVIVIVVLRWKKGRPGEVGRAEESAEKFGTDNESKGGHE